MPIYAFRCRECGHEFEELVQKMGQTAPCPKCGCEQVERQVSAPAPSRGAGGSGSCGAPSGSPFG